MIRKQVFRQAVAVELDPDQIGLLLITVVDREAGTIDAISVSTLEDIEGPNVETGWVLDRISAALAEAKKGQLS